VAQDLMENLESIGKPEKWVIKWRFAIAEHKLLIDCSLIALCTTP
jgi:hypothetical protein